MVAVEHRPYLRDGLVRLVYEEQIILREEVHQSARRLSCLSAGDVPRVVLDALAKAGLPHHVYVIARALLESVCSHRLAFVS